MPDMLVRYKDGKTTFEIPTKEGAATKYREGILKSIEDVITTDLIFTNFNKAQKASSDQLKSSFNTDDTTKVIQQILKKGEIQLSSAERKEKVDKKRKEIVEWLHKNYVDPSKNPPLPIPITRIENAMNEMKARVYVEQAAERQGVDLAGKMMEIIPMRKATMMKGQIRIGHKMVGAAGNVVQKHAKVLKEDYDAEGVVYQVEVSPSGYDNLMAGLTKVTKGEFEFKVEGAGIPKDNDDAGAGGKKGKGGKGGKGKKGKKGKK